MNLVIIFTLLIGLAATSPVTDDNEVLEITKDFFPKELVKYKGHHDIVNILVPINYLNDDYDDVNLNPPFFFVEADVNKQGERTDRGLYVYKNDKATKLLDHGRDAAADDETPTQVFFATKDGIYEYKEDTNEAVKYGTVDKNIIGIAKPTFGDAIYILTKDNEVFNVTEGGNKVTKINEVVGAKQIIVDYSNNLYFYGEDLEPHVLTTDGVKKIEGLPANPTSVNLIKPPIIIVDGVPAVVDNKAYVIFANGTSEAVPIEFKPKIKPTAYSMEAAIIQYYAYNKKIYAYNLLTIFEEVSGTFKDVIEENSNSIQSVATKTKQKKSKNTPK